MILIDFLFCQTIWSFPLSHGELGIHSSPLIIVHLAFILPMSHGTLGIHSSPRVMVHSFFMILAALGTHTSLES